jgi:hypothetical protein
MEIARVGCKMRDCFDWNLDKLWILMATLISSLSKEYTDKTENEEPRGMASY